MANDTNSLLAGALRALAGQAVTPRMTTAAAPSPEAAPAGPVPTVADTKLPTPRALDPSTPRLVEPDLPPPPTPRGGRQAPPTPSLHHQRTRTPLPDNLASVRPSNPAFPNFLSFPLLASRARRPNSSGTPYALARWLQLPLAHRTHHLTLNSRTSLCSANPNAAASGETVYATTPRRSPSSWTNS